MMTITVSSIGAAVRKGFTIVELIIVITVIAILATIAIVSYNGAQNNANDSAVKSDLDGVSGLLESHAVNVSSTQVYPSNTTELGALGITASKKSYDITVANNFVYCVNTTNYQSYALLGLSKSGKVFLMTQDGFTSTALTKTAFANASTICSGLSLTLVSAGMNPAGTWQSWVGGS